MSGDVRGNEESLTIYTVVGLISSRAIPDAASGIQRISSGACPAETIKTSFSFSFKNDCFVFSSHLKKKRENGVFSFLMAVLSRSIRQGYGASYRHIPRTIIYLCVYIYIYSLLVYRHAVVCVAICNCHCFGLLTAIYAQQ